MLFFDPVTSLLQIVLAIWVYGTIRWTYFYEVGGGSYDQTLNAKTLQTELVLYEITGSEESFCFYVWVNTRGWDGGEVSRALAGPPPGILYYAYISKACSELSIFTQGNRAVPLRWLPTDSNKSSKWTHSQNRRVWTSSLDEWDMGLSTLKHPYQMGG